MTEYSEYRYLIVGGGMVADSAARGIREMDPEGSIGIVAEEETPPVARPALSKKLWTDPSFAFDDAWLDTEADTGATRHAGERVVEIDREARIVRTEHGREVGYEQLLLATGGEPNRLDLPEDERIVYFRSVEDYRTLRRHSGNHRHLAVVGGSFIGTELAAALVQNDTETTLVFPQPVLGGDVFPADLANRFHRMFECEGVWLVPGATVESARIGPDDRVEPVERGERGGAGDDDWDDDREHSIVLRLSTGVSIGCDAVAIGVGVTPNVGLASAAGLDTDDGVIVDERLRTSDPRVFAAGDIASYPDAILGRRRIEHVDNATEMGRQAGRNMAGADEAYDHTPFFYSVIFGNRYEAVGTLDSSLETVEQWDGEDTGVVYYVDGERVRGVLLWNIEGRQDEARDAIDRADASDRDALRTRIPLTNAGSDG
ncbi:NAD(P)/FAD-dependent oxidoreductase [Leucobacter sp. GX24907]